MDFRTLKRLPWLRRLRAGVYRRLSHTHVTCTGRGHTLELGDALLHRCRIELSGSGHTLVLGAGARMWDVTIRLIGENQTCRIGPGARLRGGHFLLEDRGGQVEIGADTTVFDPMVVVSEGGAIRIGRDCLAAYGVDLRNSDGHSILDLATRQRTNSAGNITIGDHVWLGNQCQVLKDVTIGARAIVAARSVVTKDVGPHTLVAGIPARVIREGIDWVHERL